MVMSFKNYSDVPYVVTTLNNIARTSKTNTLVLKSGQSVDVSPDEANTIKMFLDAVQDEQQKSSFVKELVANRSSYASIVSFARNLLRTKK